MQTSIRSTTDSTLHGDLPRTENDGGNSWKQLRSSLGLARDDDDTGERLFLAFYCYTCDSIELLMFVCNVNSSMAAKDLIKTTIA